MKRRLLCTFLVLLMLISLLPGTALQVSAASEMKTGEEAIAILKQLEGFIEKPMYDNGQYSVGYGSGCDKDDYPDGITEAEADALLRAYLVDMEASVNSFIDRYSLTMEQHQFDALMLFTYNVGARWTNADGEFRRAIIAGATGNDLLYPMTLWSNASSKVQVFLVKRRLAEADLYMNGHYSMSASPNYTYVLFYTSGGVCDVQVQGYDSNDPVAPKPIPVRSGYRFMGWYTAEEGGSWINELNAETAGMTLAAHWQLGAGDPVNGTPVNYTLTVRNLSSLDVRSTPGGNEVISQLSPGQTVTIVADYVDEANVKWGKLENGGWVNVGNAIVGIVNSAIAEDPVTVEVNADNVNVRSGPGTHNTKVGTVNSGDELVILETRLVGTNKWGRFDGGWISLMYTNYEAVRQEQKEESSVITATGIVVNCESLRIRSGPGTSYAVLGSLPVGSYVEITLQTANEGMRWGKIASGWISLDYVDLTAAGSTPDSGDTTDTPENTDQENGTTDETVPPESVTGEPMTGTVASGSALRIRSGPGTGYERIGSYSDGEKVTIYESVLVGADYWGRTDLGWICLTYVELDGPLPGSGSQDSQPENTPEANGGFTDVSADQYYYDAVQWAVDNGITTGTSERTFSPDDNCTRGQTVTFLWRAAGSPEPTGSENPFTDVTEADFFYKAVLWAVEKGITQGYGSDTIFNPNGSCTRGEVATFLWRANGSPAPAGTAAAFHDVAETDYFYSAVLWAVEQGITNGYGDTGGFAPDLICNRAQIVTFLYRSMSE